MHADPPTMFAAPQMQTQGTTLSTGSSRVAALHLAALALVAGFDDSSGVVAAANTSVLAFAQPLIDSQSGLEVVAGTSVSTAATPIAVR